MCPKKKKTKTKKKNLPPLGCLWKLTIKKDCHRILIKLWDVVWLGLSLSEGLSTSFPFHSSVDRGKQSESPWGPLISLQELLTLFSSWPRSVQVDKNQPFSTLAFGYRGHKAETEQLCRGRERPKINQKNTQLLKIIWTRLKWNSTGS